jgi:hypothetical protein
MCKVSYKSKELCGYPPGVVGTGSDCAPGCKDIFQESAVWWREGLLNGECADHMWQEAYLPLFSLPTD